jgi:hypothetical protein
VAQRLDGADGQLEPSVFDGTALAELEPPEEDCLSTWAARLVALTHDWLTQFWPDVLMWDSAATGLAASAMQLAASLLRFLSRHMDLMAARGSSSSSSSGLVHSHSVQSVSLSLHHYEGLVLRKPPAATVQASRYVAAIMRGFARAATVLLIARGNGSSSSFMPRCMVTVSALEGTTAELVAAAKRVLNALEAGKGLAGAVTDSSSSSSRRRRKGSHRVAVVPACRGV